MHLDEAKRLLELQSCIFYLLEEFAVEVEGISNEAERDSLKRSTVEIIGWNVGNIISPIIAQHPRLDFASGSKIAEQWWNEARRRRFHFEASKT
jgi:hypothetical protein